MIDLGLFFLLLWVLQNAAVDVSCAIKGTENPRYALKRQKALAAGKQAPNQPRYGSRDWIADFASDAMVANTERRRAKAEEKAKAAKKDERPLDDLAEAVREEPQRPAPVRVDTEEMPEFESSVVHGDPVQGFMDRIAAHNGGTGRPECEHCGRRVNVGHLHPRVIDSRTKKVCAHCAGLMEFAASLVVPVPAEQPLDKDGLYFTLSPDGRTARSVPFPQRGGGRYYRLSFGEEAAQSATMPTTTIRNHGEDPHSTVRITRTDEAVDDRPDAQIIQFPKPTIVKEIRMATSEVNGLTTAMAFADAAANAHSSFATGGSEGYTGALANWEVGDGCIGSAREAQEASANAAAKWRKHHEDLAAQLNVKEAYQGSPDAGNKQFLLNS